MKKKLAFLTVSIASICYASAGSANNFDPQTVSPSALVSIVDDSGKQGVARLFRDNNGVSYDIVTTGLDPDRVYTVWALIFNNPRACINASLTEVTPGQQCDLGDLANPDTRPGVVWTTGGFANAAGVANFNARIARFDSSVEAPFPFAQNPLLDPRRSEIQLVVRFHPGAGGDDEAASLGADLLSQLTTFNGGCDADGACADVQLSVHRPAAARPPAGN